MLEIYKKYRQTLIDLHSSMLDLYSEEDFLNSANLLQVINNNEIEIYNRNEEEQFYDFMLYEKYNNQKNFIEKYLIQYKHKFLIEHELLLSMSEAYNSLYNIKEIKTQSYQVVLEDLLNKDIVILTDINLSQTAKPNYILFTRIIRLGRFNITSGLSMAFEQKYHDKLVKMCQQPSLFATIETNRFINIFHFNRKHGISVLYHNV